jgi:hypothetical protein
VDAGVDDAGGPHKGPFAGINRPLDEARGAAVATTSELDPPLQAGTRNPRAGGATHALPSVAPRLKNCRRLRVKTE